MRRTYNFLSVLALASALILNSCSGGTNDDADFKSSVVGANGETGKLNIILGEAVNAATIKINEGAGIVEATASLEIDGAKTDLAGTYDTETKAIILNGGEYSFVGETGENGRISGDYTNGEEDGIFAGFDATNNEVIVYCGTYTGGEGCSAPGCSGVWSATTSSGGYAVGTYFGNDGSSNGTLWGTFSDNTMTGEDDHGSIMTGTISDGVVTGTWTLTDGGAIASGTFEASTEACP